MKLNILFVDIILIDGTNQKSRTNSKNIFEKIYYILINLYILNYLIYKFHVYDFIHVNYSL